jgi:hypothetical protein
MTSSSTVLPKLAVPLIEPRRAAESVVAAALRLVGDRPTPDVAAALPAAQGGKRQAPERLAAGTTAATTREDRTHRLQSCRRVNGP